MSPGYIVVESVPGLGTTFRICLPRVFDEPKPRDIVPPPSVSPAGESILLVEDKPEVRKLAVEMLSRNGYRVYEAPDGPGALRIRQDLGKAVDLLITDIVMPAMNGRELADRLKAQDPGLKIILISGYTNLPTTTPEILVEGALYLQKPFSAPGLLSKVREALEGRIR